MKKTKLIICLLITLITLLLSAWPLTSLAADSAAITDLSISGASGNLLDGKASTYSTVTEPITLSSEEAIRSVYIVFRSRAVDFTVSNGTSSLEFNNGFLQYYAQLNDISSSTLTVTFSEQVQISDIYAFGEGELPDFVHVWEPPHEKADLLLFSSHADDEQLFFAGILPYYAGHMNYRVQVTYFTDHINEPARRQELLNGLWTVGVRNYPVISSFPDEYSESYNGALANLNRHGYTEDDVLAHQTEQLRRFKPLVVIGHDTEGEYGHGQHILNTATLIRAVEFASDVSKYPDSAEKYGLWNTPKLYLHLYKEHPIKLDWDVPLSTFGGKTAFNMTQEGFLCHGSQQFTWFREWMNGPSGNRTMASQITYLSPCDYGLYRSTVGEDILKNDFFENITIYEEQERIAAEEEAKRLEEEKKRQEEESRQEAESLQAALDAQSTAVPSEETDGSSSSSLAGDEVLFLIIIGAAAVISITVVLSAASFKKSSKRKNKGR